MHKKNLYRTKGTVPLKGGYAQQLMPGLTRYHGNLHSSGGIMRDSESEVEDGETEMVVNTSDGKSTPYIFSTYINMDGTKNYDSNKKTVADASVEIAKSGGSQEDINALARFQEKVAGRSGGKIAKKGGILPMHKKWLGGVIKYQEEGAVNDGQQVTGEENTMYYTEPVITGEPEVPSVNNIYGKNLPGTAKWKLMLDYMTLADKSDDELWIMSQGAGSTGFTTVSDEMGNSRLVRSNTAALTLLQQQREEGIRLTTEFPEFKIDSPFNEDVVEQMTILNTMNLEEDHFYYNKESKLSKKIHLALDVAGATEPFGFVADLVNSAYYGVQGLSKFNVKTIFNKELRDEVGLGGSKFKEMMGYAALSGVAAVPLIGQYGTGAKWIGKGADAILDARLMITKNEEKIKLLKTKLNNVNPNSKAAIQFSEQIADIEKANVHLNKLHYGGKTITKTEWKSWGLTDDVVDVSKGADEVSDATKVVDDIPKETPKKGRFKWFKDKFGVSNIVNKTKYANPKNWTPGGIKAAGKWTVKQAVGTLIFYYGAKAAIKIYEEYAEKEELEAIIDELHEGGFDPDQTIEGAEDFSNSTILENARKRTEAKKLFNQMSTQDPNAFLKRDGKQMTWTEYSDSLKTEYPNIAWNEVLEHLNQGTLIHDQPKNSDIFNRTGGAVSPTKYQETGFVDIKDASKKYAQNWGVKNKQALRLLNQMGYNTTDTIMSSSHTGPGGDSSLRTDNEFQVYNYMTNLYPEIIGSDGTYNMNLLNEKMKEHGYKDQFGNIQNYERFNIGNKKLHLAKLFKKAGGKVNPTLYQSTGTIDRYDSNKWDAFQTVMGDLGYTFAGQQQDPGVSGVLTQQPQVGTTGTYGEDYWSTDEGMEGFYTANKQILNEMGIMSAEDFDPSNPDHTGLFQHKYNTALENLWADHQSEFEAAGLTKEDLINFGFEGTYGQERDASGDITSRTYTPYDTSKVNQLDAHFGGYTGGSQGWFKSIVSDDPIVEEPWEQDVLPGMYDPDINQYNPELVDTIDADPNDEYQWGTNPINDPNQPGNTNYIGYNKPRNLSWMLPVIGALSQFPSVIKGMQDKPHYVTPSLRPGSKLNYADYNNQITANRRDMNTVNQFIENTAAGPAKIAMMMANQNRSREKESAIRAEERNVNRTIQNTETAANMEIANQNARDILEAERLNKAEDRTVFENKVAALEQFGKNMGTFTSDAMKFMTDNRIADAIAGETGIMEANRFFKSNPNFVVDGQITEEGQLAYQQHLQQRQNRFKWLLGNRQQQYGTYS